MMSRYDANGIETEFEPGSRGRVLRNLLGIQSVRGMQQAETNALLTTTNQLIDETTEAQRFIASDVCNIHKRWLGAIYAWAGEYRSVNITKGDFMFATSSVPTFSRETVVG